MNEYDGGRCESQGSIKYLTNTAMECCLARIELDPKSKPASLGMAFAVLVTVLGLPLNGFCECVHWGSPWRQGGWPSGNIRMLGIIPECGIHLPCDGREAELKRTVSRFRKIDAKKYSPCSITSRASEGEHRFTTMTAPIRGVKGALWMGNSR